MENWALEQLKKLELTDCTSDVEIFQATDKISSSMAPDFRRSWRLLLILEGFAIILPLLWLIGFTQSVQPSFIAALVFAFTAFMVGFIWWTRWRSMKTNWIQVRLLAELTRSFIHTKDLSFNLVGNIIAGFPELKSFTDHLAALQKREEPIASKEQVEHYIDTRLNEQIAYYQSKYDQALQERHRLSRYVTWSLDAAIFVAVAGLILVLGNAGERLLRVSGAGLFLGLVGCSLPLFAVLAQKLGAFLELDRRTGKYAQQKQILTHLKQQIKNSNDSTLALDLIKEAEQRLVGEVVDWYYEVRNSEVYYRIGKSVSNANLGAKSFSFDRWLYKISAPFAFIFKILFDRLLIVAASFILTTTGIAYLTPKDVQQTSTLRFGQLLSSPSSDGWLISPEAQNGVIFIAHGLHDGVETDTTAQGKLHWMAELQNKLKENTQQQAPDVVLIDWKQIAKPTNNSFLGAKLRNFLPSGYSALNMLQDVSAIRPSAEDLGELVGFKIAQRISNGSIANDKPIHFIGHSAGGFLVTRAAQVLTDLGMFSGGITITILDTPAPVTQDLLNASEFAAVDFYVTSHFASGVPNSDLHENFTKFEIPVPAHIDKFIEAHSYATDWYMSSIEDAQLPGFRRSPFGQPPNTP